MRTFCHMKQNSSFPYTVAFIPARGGSKGVPRKNVRFLGGIPLLAYTVQMAARAKGIDRVIVSTEDDEIASIAEYSGGDVPFLRPAHLAQDHSNLNDVLEYTHQRLKNEGALPEHYILMTMMPTSPFRNVGEMEFLVEKAKGGFHVNTVDGVRHSCVTLFSLDQEDRLYPLLPECKAPRMFYRSIGYCLSTYWGSQVTLPTYIYEIKNPVSLIDIDQWEDFFLAEQVIGQNLFDFGMVFK